MTQEAQNKAIAEACGWRFEKGTAPTYGGRNKPRGWRSPKDGALRVSHPNYLSDLNAMHEAEKVLQYPQTIAFQQALVDMLNEGHGTPVDFCFRVTHATAAQRAEAFLRCLGKWVE